VKPDFIFRRNGPVHLNQPAGGRHFGRLLAAEVCVSAVVMLDTPCSVVVRRVLATHSIRQFPLHFPSCVSPCAITFQLDLTSISCLFYIYRALSNRLLDSSALCSFTFYAVGCIGGFLCYLYYIFLAHVMLSIRFDFSIAVAGIE